MRQCCVLGRAGHVEAPSGLIVPTCTQGKMVQVVCRGRPVTAQDVSCSRLVRRFFDSIIFEPIGVLHSTPPHDDKEGGQRARAMTSPKLESPTRARGVLYVALACRSRPFYATAAILL